MISPSLYCERCGTYLDSDSRYCHQCGKVVII
ncbi:MAG: zinc-ribbon domain-containing protein [Candidatus Hermodarchaeota archaeon]